MGPLLRARQGGSDTRCPAAPHLRSGDLGAKVQPLHDFSNRRDDWHAVIPRYRRCDAGPFFWRQPPSTRLPGLPAESLRWFALGHEAELLRLLPEGPVRRQHLSWMVHLDLTYNINVCCIGLDISGAGGPSLADDCWRSSQTSDLTSSGNLTMRSNHSLGVCTSCVVSDLDADARAVF